jgi:hypothetical protein
MNEIEQPNIDMLIKKPYLFIYIDNKLLPLIQKQGGIHDVKDEGFQAFFTRIPDLDKFKDFLQSHTPIKISVAKFPKTDDSIQIRAINLKDGKNKLLSISDFDKIQNYDHIIYNKFESCNSIDEVPQVKLIFGKKFIPEFLYKIMLEEQYNNYQPYKQLLELFILSGTDVIKLKRILPKILDYLLTNKPINLREIKECLNFIDISDSTIQIQKKIPNWDKLILQLEPYVRRSHIEIKKDVDLQQILSMLAILKTKEQKSTKILSQLLEIIPQMFDFIKTVQINRKRKYIIAFFILSLVESKNVFDLINKISDPKLDIYQVSIIKIILYRILDVVIKMIEPEIKK